MGSARFFALALAIAAFVAVALGASAASSDTTPLTNPKHFSWPGAQKKCLALVRGVVEACAGDWVPTAPTNAMTAASIVAALAMVLIYSSRSESP